MDLPPCGEGQTSLPPESLRLLGGGVGREEGEQQRGRVASLLLLLDLVQESFRLLGGGVGRVVDSRPWSRTAVPVLATGSVEVLVSL